MSVFTNVGQMARVVTTIPADGEGEVELALPSRGGTDTFPARSYERDKVDIQTGAVVMVEEQYGRTVYVTKVR